jgi:hypothetical protein
MMPPTLVSKILVWCSQVRFPQGRELVDARVGEDDVEPAPRGLDGGRHPVEVGLLGHVGANVAGLIGPDVGDGSFEGVLAAPHEEDVGPVPREGARPGEADPGRCSGDECGFACQVRHVFLQFCTNRLQRRRYQFCTVR